MLGVQAANHPKWENPFLKAEYFSPEEADIAPYYDALKIKNGDNLELPFHVNPFDLKKEQLSFINKDNLESLDISNDAQKSLKKKRVCIGIAYGCPWNPYAYYCLTTTSCSARA